jgi:hypothetical protein
MKFNWMIGFGIIVLIKILKVKSEKFTISKMN